MPRFLPFVAQAEVRHRRHQMRPSRHRFPFLPKMRRWNRFNARTGGNAGGKMLATSSD